MHGIPEEPMTVLLANAALHHLLSFSQRHIILLGNALHHLIVVFISHDCGILPFIHTKVGEIKRLWRNSDLLTFWQFVLFVPFLSFLYCLLFCPSTADSSYIVTIFVKDADHIVMENMWDITG